MTKGFLIILLLVLTFSDAFSQGGSSGARIGATVIEPITVPKSVDLNFESVAIIVAGSVELTPSHIKSKTANIILPVTTGTFTAASFIMTNTTAYSYKISVPQAPLEVTNGNNTFIIKSFDSDPIINTDSDLFAGVFVSVSPMNVTVNYN